MGTEQGTLFDKRPFKGQQQTHAIAPPTPDMSVGSTLPAYHVYLSSGAYSKYTPDDFTADLKRFALFTGSRPLSDVQMVDIQQWIATLKETMPAKTVSRKVSAIGNYFRWLDAEKVLEKNPAKNIRAARVTAPLPDVLFEKECERLLAVASNDPRTYLLVLLLLETGIKKAELLELTTDNFDLSNKYQPELWIKHTGKQVYKDRRVKLPMEVTDVFNDYIERYGISGTLFPYTQRFVTMLLNDVAKQAGITKQVSAGILRDMFVVRGVKRGQKLEELFEKIGLAKSSYDDARKKYGKLTREAL